MRIDPENREATARLIAEKAKELRALSQQSKHLGFLAYLLATVVDEAEHEASKPPRS